MLGEPQAGTCGLPGLLFLAASRSRRPLTASEMYAKGICAAYTVPSHQARCQRSRPFVNRDALALCAEREAEKVLWYQTRLQGRRERESSTEVPVNVLI